MFNSTPFPQAHRRLVALVAAMLALAFGAGGFAQPHSSLFALAAAILIVAIGIALYLHVSKPLLRPSPEAESRANTQLEQRIAERTKALLRANDLLRATSEVQQEFLAGSEAGVHERILDRLLTLAQSSAGFVVRWNGFQAPPEPLARTYGTNGFETDEMLALAAAVAAKGMPAMGEQRNGMPTLGVPLFHGAELVGVTGLRGRVSYNYELLHYLEPYLNACAHLLHESRLASERAREREKLKSILLNVQDIIFRMDMEGRLSWISPSVETLTGYRLDELLGRNVSEFVDETSGFTGLSEALIGGKGRVTNFEVSLLRKDGERFCASASCQYFLDEAGLPAGIEGVVRDVSAYKRAEQRIEALNRLYAVLSEANKAIVRQQDRHHLYEQICRILIEHGGFRMAWIGEVAEARLVPAAVACDHENESDDLTVDLQQPRGASMPIAASVREKRHVVVQELGDERLVARGYRCAASLPFFAEGEVAGALTVYAGEPRYYNSENVQLLLSLAADISFAIERLRDKARSREVMEDLRRVGEKLTHHIEHTPLAVVEFDHQFKVRQWNAAAERIFGFTAAQVAGRSGDIIIPPEERATTRAIFSQLLQQCGGGEAVTKNITADGRTVVCEWYNTPLTDSSGAVTGVMGVAHDVTEVTRSRDEILALNATLERRVEERTRELAAVNRELESFSYSVSHDLRAPLRSIEGFPELLMRRNEHLDETSKDYLHRVQAASARMNGLIDSLLDLSRMARAEVRCERVDLSALAREAIEELQHGDAMRTVTVKIVPDALVLGDERLLRVALANLLRNAWKFTQRVVEPRIEFGVAGDEAQRIYFVRDNGAGFDMAYVGKLFGAFQRLHSVQEFEGTGIGLATVQRIINRHRGRIWAEGAVEGGATFFFTLGTTEMEATQDGTTRNTAS